MVRVCCPHRRGRGDHSAGLRRGIGRGEGLSNSAGAPLWTEVGTGVYKRRYRRLDQNIVAIVGGGSVLVVDSRATHPDADELRSDLAALTSSPVDWLVNTHFHWDHTFGNSRFPESTIVGHTRCRSELIAHGEEVKVELTTEDWIPVEERHLFLEVAITPPVVTFGEKMDIYLGDRRVSLWHPGLGHTNSDIVVMVDDVCVAGDLVEQGAPPSFGDSHPKAWVRTLEVLASAVDGPVIPGHGDVVDAEFVRSQRDELTAAIGFLEGGGEGLPPFPESVMATIGERLTHEATPR
ncbi:MAG: MBL fold metallo-hydrolase [Acidimicrobiia bacterium]